LRLCNHSPFEVGNVSNKLFVSCLAKPRLKPLNLPKVLLADDSADVLEAVSRMLTPEFDIVGRVNDGLSLISEARRLSPDVIVVDLFMPGLSGIEVARELRRRHNPGSIISLTIYDDASFMESAQAMGAMGYVLKSSADRDLVPAIREALQGRFYHSPSLKCQEGERPRRIIAK
jgi:DNA-binding NarL/FixJ family response regulator